VKKRKGGRTMTAYKDLSKDELKALKKELTRKFEGTET